MASGTDNAEFLQSHGVKGGIVVSDTNEHTGNWQAIRILSDAVFTSITLDGAWSGTMPESLALTAGDTLIAGITAFTLASGSVMAYKSVFQ